MTTTALAVLDPTGVVIASRPAMKKRTLTHAVVREAETVDRVRARHEARSEADRNLLGEVHEAIAADPVVRTAGGAGSGRILVQPPAALRDLVELVYGRRDASVQAVEEYRRVLESHSDALSVRIQESDTVISALDAGEYELKPAEVLYWASSRQLASAQITRLESKSRERWNMLGLKVAELTPQGVTTH